MRFKEAMNVPKSKTHNAQCMWYHGNGYSVQVVFYYKWDTMEVVQCWFVPGTYREHMTDKQVTMQYAYAADHAMKPAPDELPYTL